MQLANWFQKLKTNHRPQSGGLEILKYIGPGLLVTVGFIDPGNWASNLGAGSEFGYALLWVVTFSSIMLIVFQHNVAHLGIVTGLCLAEATTQFLPSKVSKPILLSALIASVSTTLAELLGGAIALQMLFGIPLKIGASIIAVVCAFLLFTNTYKRTEKYIIGFVSIIGLAFLYELYYVNLPWNEIIVSAVKPSFPHGSLFLMMSILGAVVMPHNLFLHSEVIQSRAWNLEDETLIRKQLKYEFVDTLFSMGIGWAINSAMIILAAASLHQKGIILDDLAQAKDILSPILGNAAGVIFAMALLLAGLSSTITSGIAGASIFSGMFSEAYQPRDIHSKIGTLVSYIPALIIIFFIVNPYKGLIYSQVLLSIQLPITVFTQLYLTSSKKVMGQYVNSKYTTFLLVFFGISVTLLNIALLLHLN